MPSPVTVWASVAEKALGIIERFLDPAQYTIVKAKRTQKALNVAEKGFQLTSELIAWAEDNLTVVMDHKELLEFKKEYKKLKARFDKYD